MQRFKALTMGKPVVMGRKTFESLDAGRCRGAPTSSSRAMRTIGPQAPSSRRRSPMRARSRTGDALRRLVTEIAVIGGAEIYAQWMAIRRPPGSHRSSRAARLATRCFRQSISTVWEEVARVQESGRRR